MSDAKYNARADLSEINGKPVDAVGHMLFQIDFDHFKSPFCIEKIFGLVDVKTNAVFKFKLVVSEDGPTNINFKLTYVSDEPIDCKIKIGKHPSEILEHLTISEDVKNFQFKKGNPRVNYCFGISVLVATTTSMSNVFARMFNNPSTSDFIVNCQDKVFYVHQSILRERSEYFEAILHNDCIEKRDKTLKINDFKPNVVELFLRYLYNGALPIPNSLTWGDMIGLMRIADKYNANELFDAMDSHISQGFLLLLNWSTTSTNFARMFNNPSTSDFIKRYLKEFEGIQAPKVTTMFFKWRSTEKGSNCLDDNKWSNLIRKNPNFAMLGGIIFGRSDYQNWFQQHRSWWLSGKQISSTGRNDFAVLVGPIGEMKGAVKCSPI